MKASGCTVFRPFSQSFIPVSLERWHLAAGRNIEAQLGAERITFVAPAADFFRFDAGGMLDFQRPKDTVEYVTTHVPQGAIPKIIPAMPFVRMKIGVVIAERRRPNPTVPMH